MSCIGPTSAARGRCAINTILTASWRIFGCRSSFPPPGPIDIRVITSIAAMAGVFSASPVGIAKNSSDLSYHQLRDGAGPGRGALQSRRRRASTGRFLEAAGGALDAGGRSQSRLCTQRDPEHFSSTASSQYRPRCPLANRVAMADGNSGWGFESLPRLVVVETKCPP